MFKALMGGGDASSRSSRRKSTADGDDARSSSRRQSKRSSASSVSSSRRSTRGDDRDRDLGDLSASRSVAGESTATYVTAEPQSYAEEEPLVIERVPRYVTEEEDRAWENKSSRRDSKNKERRDTKQRSARDEIDSERVRTRSGKKSSSAETTSQHFADDIAAPGFNQFPMQYDAAIPGPSAPSHSPLDPHLAQQFPGQMSGAGTQPYIPPNPAGLAAEYYGDQGQSVANQPGVRPRPPDVIVGAEPHLMSASPLANPPPEPSSLGQVGAAADYYAAADLNSNSTMSTPSKPSKPGKTSKPSSKPSKQSKPSKPSKPTPQGTAGVGAATYGISPELLNQASSNYPGMSGSLPNPIIQQITASTSPQHGIGLALGGATAGAAAAYMINHHHSNSDHQNDTYGIGVPPRPGNFTSNGNTPSQGGPVYDPQYLNGPPPTYPSGGMQPGSLAYHQRHHGPLAKFIDFWKDPEGVGKFEDYTEAIGVCKYCFEPGSSSRDAPRKHHYNRRKRSPVVERYGSSTRVDKLSRYASSEDESRRSKSKSGSWLAGGLAGGLAGYVAKSLFNNKDFDDTYSVRSGRQVDSRSYNYDEASAVSSGKASSTSRGVYSSRPVSDSKVYTSRDSRSYKVSRRSSRSRSRSRSRDHRGLKEAAIGAAVGSALTAAAAGSLRHRSTSRNRSNSRERSSHRHIRRTSNSSEHLYIDGPRGRRRSSPKGFKSFFSAPSANRRKKHASKRRGFFSFGNSSSSSGDYDLAFGGPEVFGSSVSGRSIKSSRSTNKHSKPNVDAEILGLGLAARQLAHASSSRRDVHPRDLARPSKHSGPLSHEDEEWEDAESSDSALSTNLAYGGSELFGSQESVGGSSFWPWGSSKNEKRRQSNQEFAPTVSNDYGISPSGLENYSSSTLQQVYPVPTGDPSRFDAVRMSTSSSPNVQPPLVRPGPIPLQQPQPITPVSQSVYYPSMTGPPILPGDSQFTTRSEDAFSYPEPHRRNSSPVIPTAPLDGTPSPGILKRRSTAKDSAAVSFALTQEQADRQQKADRREKERLARRREENRLREETEEEERLQERNERKREERRRREELEAEEAAREARRQTRREEIRDERESEDRSSSSWVTPAVAAVGTAAVASIVAENFSKDKKSTSNRKRYEESREKRRSERRRASENQEDVTEMSYDEDRQYDDEDEYKKKEERIAKIAASRIVRNKSVSPTYESYVDFFKPEELQNETSHDIASIDRQNASDSDISVIPPVRINIIEPTPPASHDGSVRDTHSPVPTPEPTIEEQPREEDAEAEVELYRTNSGSRVSWGEDRTHEYEVVTPLSEKDEPEPIHDYHDNISLRRDPVEAPSQDGVTKGTAQEDQTSQNVAKHYMPGGFEDDSEFAATLAAGAEMAGFDPSVVTHDASYYRRDSPPGSELKGTYRSSIVESVEDSSDRRSIASRAAEKTVPDVGEKIVPKEFEPTDSSDKKSSKDEPKEKRLYEQNTDIDGEENVDFGDTSRSVASVPVETGRKKSKKSKKSKKAAKARNDAEIEPEERSESLPSVETPTASQYEDRALDRAIVDQKSDSDKVEETRSKKSSRSRKGLNNELEERSTPLPSTENPDVFQYEDKDRDFKSDSDGAWKSRSKKSTKTRKDSDTEPEELSKRPSFTEVSVAVQEDDEESYRDTVEYKSDSDKVQETRSKKSSKSRKDIDTEPETDSLDYKNTSDKVREIKEDWDEDERERRRRKSKRSSKDREDSMDDARSVAASAPGADELEKYRSRRSKRDEEDFDDDTRSLYDVDGDGDKRRRRRHKRHSGAFDDDTVSVTSAPANIDETREKRRSRESSVAKDKEKEADQDKKSSGFFSNLFGSKSTVERSSASSDKRDVRSEVGVDEYSKSERRRKKRSSGAFSEVSQSVMDLSQPVRGNEGEESEDDSQSSRRRRREQERRNKYEGIVGSARDASEKERYISADDADENNDQKRSFLGERPGMPPMTSSSMGLDIQNDGGASGLPVMERLDSLRNDLDDKFQQMQRYRSRSVSPSSSEKVLDVSPKSHSRPPSPSQETDFKPRRLSMLKTTSDSPTAVPLHFRKPPTSPNGSRRVSMSSPGQSPSSPKPGHRRPTSIEFKNVREIRPLWLVERHSSGKFEAEPDVPLPSLPSSKTTSRSTSVEDLREASNIAALTDSLIQDGPSYNWDRRPTGLRISTDHPFHDEDDYLNSQQATPTAETYKEVSPPAIKKEKPKYQFHSPSELLQDPTLFHPDVPEPPASLDPLPSVAGSVVSEKEAGTARGEMTDDHVISPHNSETIKEVSAPEEKSSGMSSFLAGAGFASLVNAAVSKAVESHDETRDSDINDLHEPEEQKSPHREDVVEELRDASSEPSLKEGAQSPKAAGGFGSIVDAAVAAAVGESMYSQINENKVDSSKVKTDLPDEILQERKLDISESELKLVQEDTRDTTTLDDPTPMISKKQKRKDKKKRQKNKDSESAPLDDDENKASSSASVETTTAATEAERAEPAKSSADVPAAAEQFTSDLTELAESSKDQPSVDVLRSIDETELCNVPTIETDSVEVGEKEASPTSNMEQEGGDANDEPTRVPAESEDMIQSTPKSQQKKKKNKKKAQSLSSSLEQPETPMDGLPASATADEPNPLKIQTQDPSSPLESPGPSIMTDELQTLETQRSDFTPIEPPASTQQTEETWDDGFTMSKSQKKKNKKKQKGKSLSLREESAEAEARSSKIQPLDDEIGIDAGAPEKASQELVANQGSDEQAIFDGALVASDEFMPEHSVEDAMPEPDAAQTITEELVTSDTLPEIGERQHDKELEAQNSTLESQDIHETVSASQSEEKSDEYPVETSTKQSKSKKKKKKRQLLLDGDDDKPSLESTEASVPHSDGPDISSKATEIEKHAPEERGEDETSLPMENGDPKSTEDALPALEPEEIVGKTKAADPEASLGENQQQSLQPATDPSHVSPDRETVADTSEIVDDTARETEEATAVEQLVTPDESSESRLPTAELREPTEAEELPKEHSDGVQDSTEQPAADDSEQNLSKKAKRKKKKSISLPSEDEPVWTEKASETVSEPEFAIVQPDKDNESSTPVEDFAPSETATSDNKEIDLTSQAEEPQKASPADYESDLVSQGETKLESEPEQSQISGSKSKKKKGKKGKRVSWVDETSFQPVEEPAVEPEGNTTTKSGSSVENGTTTTVETEQTTLSTSQSPSLSKETEQSPLARTQPSLPIEIDSQAALTQSEPSSNIEEEHRSCPMAELFHAQTTATETETITSQAGEDSFTLEAESSGPIDNDESTTVEDEKFIPISEKEPLAEESEDGSKARLGQDSIEQQETLDQAANEPAEALEPDERNDLAATENEDWSQSDSKGKRKKDKKKEKKRKKALESLVLEDEEPTSQPVNKEISPLEPSEVPMPEEKIENKDVEVQPSTENNQQPDPIIQEPTEDQDLDALIQAQSTIGIDNEWTQETNSKKKKDKKKKRKSLQVETEAEAEAAQENIGQVPKDSTELGDSVALKPRQIEATMVLETPLDEIKTINPSPSPGKESQLVLSQISEGQELQVNSEEIRETADNDTRYTEQLALDTKPSVDSSAVAETNEEPSDSVQPTEPVDIDSQQNLADEPQALTGKSKKKSKKNKKKQEPMPWDEPEPEPVPEELGESSNVLLTEQQAADDTKDKDFYTSQQDFDSTPEKTVTAEPQEIDEPIHDGMKDISRSQEDIDVKPVELEKPLSAKEKRKEKKKKRQTLDLSNEEPISTTEAVPDTQELVEQASEKIQETKDEILSGEPSADGFSVAEKKKGKKKKRQSLNWEDDIIEAAAGEESKEASNEEMETRASIEEPKETVSQDSPSHSEENTEPRPVLEDPESTLQETPVEVDGKETFQSSDKIDTDTKEKDFDWTDNVVSSQVQAQTKEPPYPVPSPTLVEYEDALNPSPTEDETQSREVDNVEGSSQVLNEENKGIKGVFVDIDNTPQEAESESWITSSGKTGKGKNKKKKKKQNSIFDEVEKANESPTQASIDFVDGTDTFKGHQDTATVPTEEVAAMPQEPIPIEQEKSILADVKSSGEYKEREGMHYDGTGESEVEAKDLAIEEDRAHSDSLSITGKNIEISSISPDVALDPESAKLVQESSAGPKPQETLNQVETKDLTLEEPQKINEETPVESTVQDESTAKYFENNTLEEVEFETPAPIETMSRKISKKDKRKQKKKGKKNPDFDDEENDLAVTEETTTSEKGQGADDKVSIDVSVPNIDGEPTIREPIVTEFDAAQQGQQIAELVPAMQQTLDRKLSKKEKRKNAKKGLAEVKDNEIDDDYVAHKQNMNLVAEEYMTGEAHDTEPIEGSSADVMNIPTHVSLDPFDVSNADDELFDASVQPSYDFNMDLDTNDSQGANQTRDAEALEKEDDLAVAADLFEEPTSTVSPNPKKSSKKQEKNKKGKAALYEEPERVVATDETQDYENPPVEVAAKSVTIQNDEVLMRRDSKSSKAKGKKKKKRESSIALEQDETLSQTYHSTSPPTEEPAAVGQEQHYIPPNLADPAEKTVQSWPSIEFDKERTATTSDLSAKSTPSDNPVSHHAEDRDMTRHLEIREEDPENTIDDFVDKMPTDAVPESGETPLDDTWSIPVSKTRKKKKSRKHADYEDDQSHNDTRVPAPFTELDKNIADTEPTSGQFSYPAVPQPLHEQTVLETARDLTSDDHTPSSQEMDVDVVSKMAMAAAGFDTSREVMETDSTPEDFQKVNSKGRKPKDITSIYEQKDKPNETQSYRGAFSNTDSQSSTKAGTTNKISNIFPGLERAPYRRPSPKSGTKQVNEPNFDTVSKSPSPPEPTEPRSSSMLFKPSRSTGFDHVEARVRNNTPPSLSHQSSSDSLHRTKSIHGHHSGASHGWKLDDESTPSKQSPRMLHTDNNSPPRTPLDPIREHDGPHADTPRLVMDDERYILPRPDSRSSVRSSQSLRRANRSLSSELRAAAAEHMQAARATSDEDHTDSQKHQKRSGGAGAGLAADSATGRSQPLEPAEQQIEDFADHHHIEDIPSSSTYDPVTDKGKRPVRGMSDVYEGWGETPNSPRSPTRPPSVRRRQSMQHISELESRLDQLVSENRLLAAAKEEAEHKLSRSGVARRKSDQALNSSNADLRDKEAEISRLTSSLEWMQSEVQRLTQENESLSATHTELTASHAREVDNLRTRQVQLATGMEGIVREQISAALAEKDAELRRLRDELAAARQTVQELQQQIVAATADDVLSVRDEDYFDNACQRLCQHVQQWVLRFSKHSDLRRCRPLAEVRDSKIADRFENAILDGSDVDIILADRVRRRDIFVAVVMAMIWEYIFTRYLFGMDREQRQKLKALEKQLSEIGPRPAVAHWRALTLTLLAKRPSFAEQRVRDTEAVALEIMGTLSQLLPPPQTAESQLLESLRGVLRRAGNLSIEMRTQRAEYIMLPPLQPEYDIQGDLARQVVFNASLMNERSGAYTSNEPLEAQGVAVRLVLFPLVVKKGNDSGDGDDEIVVCPAQVLVARPEGDKTRERDRMSIIGNRSVSSVVPSINMENMI